MRADVKKRLGYELGIISRKGFSAYFLVVHDIVSRWPRTCGRGSSASSIVSYLLGITHVDPLRYNLFFERFLNMGRKDPPDIDVDFPWDEREKALSYVFERYPGSSGMVADHITFGPRSCIREPAKAFGMEEGEIKRMVSLKRQGGFADIPGYLLRAARRLQGMPSHIGTHPGGVVVTPGPITDYTHVQTSPLGRPVIAWEKDAAEDAGLVKIDLLGNRSLAVMRDCISIVNPLRKCEGRRPIEWESFDPLSDGATRRSIESGETLGVFYVESPATRQLLKKMRTGDYEHLVIASSIIRPAANRYIQEYVRRLRGGAYEPIHPSIADTLRETLGIMVYQEDVARVAIDACGFSPEEADLLRKVLTKKDRELRLASYRERFFEGGRGQGLTDDLLEALWDMILSFDGYSFCKAHSASYALVSYRLAWLKRRYPLEFMASVINNGGGFYARQVYVNAVRRMGFPVLGPDVNASALTYTVEAGAPGGKGAGGKALRVGLLQLKGIDQGFLENIYRERGLEGAYRDFFDFVCRLRPSPSDMRVLIRSGSLDSVASGFTRPEMFWAFFHREKMRDFFDFPVTPGCLGDYTRGTKLLDEMSTLDLIVSCMPISLFESRVARLVKTRSLPPCIDSRVIADYSGTRVCIPASLVTGKEVRTKKKRNMCFVSFEDRYSLFESVLFPEAWERFADLLDAGTAFLVIGMVEEDFGAHQLRVEDMIPLSRVSGGIDFGGRQRELPAVWRGAYA